MNEALATGVYDHCFRNGSYAPPSSFYAGLSDADWGVEIDSDPLYSMVAPEYARVGFTPSAETYPGQSWNATPITFPTPVNNWGWIDNLDIYAAATGGTPWISNMFGIIAAQNIWEGNWIDGVATINLLLTNTPTSGDEVTIDGVVYKFVTALVDPYDVLIAGQANSARNLASAINADSEVGVRYGTGTVAHPRVEAYDPYADENYKETDGYVSEVFIHLRYTGVGGGNGATVVPPPTGMFVGPSFGGAASPLVIPVDGLHFSVSNGTYGTMFDPFATRLHNWLLRGASYHNPRPFAALFTTMPGADGTGGVEVTGASYARQDLDAGGTPVMGAFAWSFSYGDGKNSSPIDFGTLGESWGNVKGMVLIDQYDPGGGSIEEPMIGKAFTPFDGNAADEIEILTNGFTIRAG